MITLRLFVLIPTTKLFSAIKLNYRLRPLYVLHNTREFGKLSKTNLLFRNFKILSPHSGNYEDTNCHAESGGTES
jgi:hypothetical protein